MDLHRITSGDTSSCELFGRDTLVAGTSIAATNDKDSTTNY